MIKLSKIICLLIMVNDVAYCDETNYASRIVLVEKFSKDFEVFKRDKTITYLNKALIGCILTSDSKYCFMFENKYTEINNLKLESFPFLKSCGQRYDAKTIILEDYASKLESENPKLKEVEKIINIRAEEIFSRKNPVIGLTPEEISNIQDFAFLEKLSLPPEILSYWALCKAQTSSRYFHDEIFHKLFCVANKLSGDVAEREDAMNEMAKKNSSFELSKHIIERD